MKEKCKCGNLKHHYEAMCEECWNNLGSWVRKEMKKKAPNPERERR